MGERKVLNRYVPPDFDPSIIPKFKRSKGSGPRLMEIRMMLPFSMRCNTCGEYMYAGKKFNSKKEMTTEDYMGIKRIRFYIKCTSCSAEITFMTDPKNSDYTCESGASRNFELWRDTASHVEADSKQRAEEEEHDAMKGLENRMMDNQMEMQIMDGLEGIKAQNQRHHTVDTDRALAAIRSKADSAAPSSDPAALTAEDEELIKSIRFRSAPAASSSSSEEVPRPAPLPVSVPKPATAALPIIVKKKRKIDTNEQSKESKPQDVASASSSAVAPAPAGALGGLFDYGASSDEDERE